MVLGIGDDIERIQKLLGSFKRSGIDLEAFKGTYLTVFNAPLNVEVLLRMILNGEVKFNEEQNFYLVNEYYYKYDNAGLMICDY